MGKRGPLAKSTALKIFHGTLDRRPSTQQSPQPVREAPPMPSCLDKLARQQWSLLVPELSRLRLLTVIDGAILAAYCAAVSQFYTAQLAIQRKGLVMTMKDGTVRKRPEVGIGHEAARLIQKLGAELGLTPASRCRIRVSSDYPAKDAMEEFLQRGKAARFFGEQKE